MNKMKYVSVFIVFTLIVSLFSQASLVSADGGNWDAQIHHAVGVDEYGSNISDVSTLVSDVPIEINQHGTNIQITVPVDDEVITVSAFVRGKNANGNLLYFDTGISSTQMQVLTCAYIDSFSPNSVLSQEYIAENPNVDTVLLLYLKVNNATSREYYFIEIFGFELINYSSLMNNTTQCEPDFWSMKEFKPISCSAVASSAAATTMSSVSPRDLPDPEYLTLQMTYYMFLTNRIIGYVTLKVTNDTGSIPKSGSDDWMHTIELTGKYTLCPNNSDFSSPDSSPLRIAGAVFRCGSPKNCAYLYNEIDGEVTTSSSVGGNADLSASISVGFKTISASLNLTGSYTPKGTIDINDTFSGHVNNTTQASGAVKLVFDSDFYLYNVGDNYKVLSCMKDYGDVITSNEVIQTEWLLHLENEFGQPEDDYDHAWRTNFFSRVQ